MNDLFSKGGCFMKGYITGSGFMGYIDGKYMLFASEGDYFEYLQP